MKKTLTDRTLKALKPATTGKRYTVWDAALPNFGVRVTDKGKLSFVIMRRLNGKLLRRALGEYPVLSLAKARTDAQEALRDIAGGIDPKAKRVQLLATRQHTFALVAEDFIKRHVSKLRSGREVEAVIRRELVSRWAERPINEITRRDVIAMVEEIVDDGRPYSAHYTLAYCRKLFNWALARDVHFLAASPCDRIRPKDAIGIRQPRQRVLQDDEIRAIWRAAATLGYPFGALAQLLLLTGQRLREVAEMRWDEVNSDKALWIIPATRMKGGVTHVVPLSEPALALLMALPRWNGPYVFSTTGGERPVSGFSKAKAKLDRVLGLDFAPWRFHDLRRTMRTGLSALPVSHLVAEIIIAHQQPGLHRTYDLHRYDDEKRRALTLWSERLTAILGGPEEGNVVPLASVRR